MAVPAGDRRIKVDLACDAGKEFSKLFYETFDKRRHLLVNLYMDDGHLVWNGTPVIGKRDIGSFIEKLPTSECQIRTVDAQPVLDEFVQCQTSIVVTTSGTVRFSGKKFCPFTESFLLAAQGDVWKIVSDCFRFHEPL